MSWYGGSDLGKLVGLTVTAVEIDEDREGMTLQTTRGPVRFQAFADCCSHTWIESIDDESAMLGTIREVENIEMPEASEWKSKFVTDPDAVAYYGMKFTTEKGRAVVDFRNDSNGYYGGSLDLMSFPGAE